MEETIATEEISASRGVGRRHWRVLSYIGLALLAIWAAYTCWDALKELIRLYNPFPTWDYWRVVQFLDRYQALDPRVLWRQHNEHRIVFPEIVFAADMLLFRGRLLLPIVVSVLCYAAAWALLCCTVVADAAVSYRVKLAAIFLSAAVVGWKGIAVVLAVPFLLQWTLLEACVVASLWALWGARGGSRAPIWISIALAIMATYTSGNGMFLWAVLVLFGFVAGVPRRRILLVAIAGALAIAVYFFGYTPSSSLDLSNFWRHPLYSLEFIGAYLGMPFGGIKGPLFGPCAGLANLGVTITLAVFAWRQNLLRSRALAVLLGFYAFVFLSLLIIAAGRIGAVRDSHFSGAEAPRYLAVPLLNWAAVILLLIWISARLRWKIVSPAVCCILLAVLIGLGFPKLRWWLKYQRIAFANEEFASLAVADEITNYQITRHVFPDPGFVAVNLPKLRQQHLSIFSEGRFDLIGRPLADAGKITNRTADGAVTYLAPIEGGGIEVAGWCAEQGWILLLDKQNRVVGLGERLTAELPYDGPSRLNVPGKTWFAFAKINAEPASISAYVITSHGLEPLQHETVVEAPFTAKWK